MTVLGQVFRSWRIAACATLFALSAPIAWPSPVDVDVDRRVEDLLARMTLEEKIGQLNLAPNNPAFDDGDVRAGRIGGVLAFNDAGAIARVQDAARRSRLGIPLLVGLDVVHGFRTMFPVPLGEAASFDPGLAWRVAASAAREAASVGINWTFAPVADLARDPRWGRMVEGFGEDPFLGRLFTAARVRGFHDGGLATTLKHFAGYGAARGGRDYDAVELSTADLFDDYLPPFEAGIAAGSESVMSGFHALNGIPASANPRLTTDILRRRWAYDGYVVSDWDAIAELVDHGVAAGPAEAARKALLAGVDVDMASGLYARHLAGEVADGRVPEAAVTEAARRVLRAKFRMGLFDRTQPRVGQVGSMPDEASRALARQAARDTMVLLRNDGTLPLRPGARIAVIGAMADSGKDLIGPHGAVSRWEDGVPLLEGLRRRAAATGVAVAFAPGCDASCAGSDGFDAAVAAARGADVVIAVQGEPLEFTGEAASRAHLTLPGHQAELLERLLATGTPVVLVLLASRPIELGRVVDRLAGLVMAWFPGTEGGTALGDLLSGDVDFSAKLPVTWPRTIGQVPLTYDGLPSGRPPDPRNPFTLRYVDEALSPLFPFGFGMSYARFTVSDLTIATPKLSRRATLEVEASITNTGDRDGRDVAQLYLRQTVASVSRPLRQLKAIEKVALARGETKRIRFRVPASELGYHREDGSYVVEPGPFEVYVGDSSAAALSGAFELVAD